MVSLSLGALIGAAVRRLGGARRPAVVRRPVLAGRGEIGTPVTIDPGDWSGTPGPTLALQWRLDGADLPGATAPRFTPTLGQAGQLLSCRILAGNAAGSAAAESLPLVVHAASFPSTGRWTPPSLKIQECRFWTDPPVSPAPP